MILTEPIGSIPRPSHLIDAVTKNRGDIDDPALAPLFVDAIRDTLARFEATGSPVLTDGEQRKYHNFWDYCVHGLPNVRADGFKIPFAAGHVRRMPRLVEGPFRFKRQADRYLEEAQRHTKMPERDGYAFMRDVRSLPVAEGGRTPAIALTAFARSEDRTRAMLSGYQVHVAKPIEPDELVATVKSQCGAGM
jgi:5-methyltetrahydropteroyltriglutamate--homocysteine methyltransferase